MPMYFTAFYTFITAKNEKDLSRKVEATAEKFSEKIHKKVEVHGYAEVEQGRKLKVGRDTGQTTLGD